MISNVILFLMLTYCGLKGNTVGWYGMTDPHNGFISSRFRCDYRWGLNWWMNLLTTYAHHSELQVIIVLLLVSTLCRLLAHTMSPQSSLGISWQRLLTMEILQFPMLRASCHSCPCRTLINYKLNYSTTLLSLPCRAQLTAALNWTAIP
jgi:hypothetical protein